MSKYIIAFLTVNPSKLFLEFIKKLKKPNYDIYVIIDDNDYKIDDIYNNINFIYINNYESEKLGFKGSLFKKNNIACSRDKALYYFSHKVTNYDYIWLIEEDVFIPNIETIFNIDHKYIDNSYDLLVSKHDIYNIKQHNWLWSYVYNQTNIGVPYACAMICAIRCSKELLMCISKYAKENKSLFLDEALFNTIAEHNKLNVKIITELSSIVWKKNWEKSEINIDNLYHPIKDINLQYDYRK